MHPSEGQDKLLLRELEGLNDKNGDQELKGIIELTSKTSYVMCTYVYMYICSNVVRYSIGVYRCIYFCLLLCYIGIITSED